MIHSFTLTDADGAEHFYEVTPHRHSTGRPLVNVLAALLAGPLLNGLGSLIGGVQEAEAGASLLDSIDLEALDFESMGPAVVEAIGRMPVDLPAKLFAHTMRDGKRLSDEGERAVAFSRNYREEERAIWEVVKYNRFLMLPGILKAKR